MVRMYNPLNGVLVWVTVKFIARWKQLGFIKLSDHILIFPQK